MRIVVKAKPGELEAKASELAATLVERLAPHCDLASALRKAEEGAAPGLKFPALRGLQERAGEAYRELVGEMIAEIAAAIDGSRFEDHTEVVSKGGEPPGTIHTWHDGRQWQKQGDGRWTPVAGPAQPAQATQAPGAPAVPEPPAHYPVEADLGIKLAQQKKIDALEQHRAEEEARREEARRKTAEAEAQVKAEEAHWLTPGIREAKVRELLAAPPTPGMFGGQMMPALNRRWRQLLKVDEKGNALPDYPFSKKDEG
jgi:hypothetical protein